MRASNIWAPGAPRYPRIKRCLVRQSTPNKGGKTLPGTFPQIARASGVLASSIRRGACARAWFLAPLQGAAARRVAVCALELGCWCCCRVPLPNACMCDRARAWLLVSVQDAAALLLPPVLPTNILAIWGLRSYLCEQFFETS